MKSTAVLVYVSAIRILMRFFYLFPVRNNKCVITSFNGRLYNCNPKYITEALRKTGKYDIYYVLNDKSAEKLPEGVKCIRYKSPAHFFHLMTAKFVIVNSTGITGFLPFRKNQVVIQTWHGGYSFKVIGIDANYSREEVKLRELTGRELTYFLSSSKEATRQHSHAMCTPTEKFLQIGMPRNDILFQEHSAVKQRIFREFSLKKGQKIVLYAPTYRDGEEKKSISEYDIEAIDDTRVVQALNKRFGGDFVFFYKSHHNMLPSVMNSHCINASAHTDIQELLCAADVIITDYSSCMADFALQRKPGFVFAPDLEKYRSAHPLSMKPELWCYSVARNNEELLKNIASYDEKAGIAKTEDFFRRIGNCEDGHATEKLLKIMKQHRERK